MKLVHKLSEDQQLYEIGFVDEPFTGTNVGN